MSRLATAVARRLLWLAGRRWPVSTRDELRCEWAAELHVLGAGRRWVRMLAFALSLALARPDPESPARFTVDRRVWTSAGVLTAGPVAALIVGYAGAFLYALGVFGLLVFAALLWFGGLLVAYAAAAGAMLRRRSAVPAALVPAAAALLFLPELGVGSHSTLTRPTLLWAGLMAAVLIAVGLAPRPWSWWIGYAGVVAMSWVAVTWAVWLYNGSGGIRLDTSYAWLWFPASLVDLSVGPGPRDSEVSSGFYVADFTEVYPTVLMALGAYAVASVVGVCERRDFPESTVHPAGARTAAAG